MEEKIKRMEEDINKLIRYIAITEDKTYEQVKEDFDIKEK